MQQNPLSKFKSIRLWFRDNWTWLLLLILFISLASFIIFKLIQIVGQPIPPVQSSIKPTRTFCTADPASKTPLTDARFVILGLAVTLSTYISTISRGVIASIKEDLSSKKKRDNIRIDIINSKQNRFWFLLLSDFTVWLFLIAPILWNIIHWFLCLPPTNFYFHSMRMWVFGGIYIYLWYMLYLHVIQAFDHCHTINRAMRDIKKWKTFEGHQILTDSEWFLEHLGLARSLMTNDQFAVYASLAREKAQKNISTNDGIIYWIVTKDTSNITKETEIDVTKINRILDELSAIGFIKKIAGTAYQYELSKLEGVYSN